VRVHKEGAGAHKDEVSAMESRVPTRRARARMCTRARVKVST
jgi:hypothetical protein